MIKRLLAITISMLLMISMLPLIALGASTTLLLSQDSATVGSSITASGTANANEWISIKVVDSSGGIPFYDEVKSSASGDYSCTFIVPQVSPGVLTVVAGSGSNVANKSLTISSSGDIVAVTGVSLNKSNTSIVKGGSETLLATVSPGNASNKAVTWSSNQESVATVDANGKVTAVDSGTATIMVSTVDGNKAASCVVMVTEPDNPSVAVTGVSLNKSSTSIVKGGSETLLATVSPGNASNKAVTWSSNKESVATVDANGKINAVGPGTATIMASTVDGNKTASCTVTVTKPETATSGGAISVASTPLTITIPSGVSESSIIIPPNEALPLVEVKSNQVEFTIPAGTQVNAGTIKLPEVKASSSVNVAAAQQVDLVIKVGSDLGTITFSKPVRLLLKGQAGKSAGFIDNSGNFQAIGKLAALTGLISDADADAVGAALSSAGVQQGAVASGNDLIIWTKHFTEFISYTPKTTTSPGGGGGGSAITSSGQTITSSGGTIKEAGVVVTFPADAVSSDIKVTVKKLTEGIPAVSSELKMLGEVYEIASDKTSEFKKPVTITLPFDQTKVDTDKYAAGIYCWNNNQWVILDEIKTDTGTISGTVNHFSKFAVLAREKEKAAAPDVFKPADISGHWAESNINQLLAAAAVSGYPDGTFRPDNTISRAEFATILVKACKLNAKDGKVFSDTANHWARESIATAAGYGIVNGYSDTTFGPDENISREQIAVMIVKAANLTKTAEGKTFADEDRISDWAKEAVIIAGGNGIISGYQDNTFRPQANATRAEAVTVIVKAL